MEQRAVVDGDCRSAAIAAASVLAKVTRPPFYAPRGSPPLEVGLRDERGLQQPGASSGDRRARRIPAPLHVVPVDRLHAAAPRLNANRPLEGVLHVLEGDEPAGRLRVTPIRRSAVSSRRGGRPARPVSHSRASSRRRRRFAGPTHRAVPGGPGRPATRVLTSQTRACERRPRRGRARRGEAPVAGDDRVARACEVFGREALSQRARRDEGVRLCEVQAATLGAAARAWETRVRFATEPARPNVTQPAATATPSRPSASFGGCSRAWPPSRSWGSTAARSPSRSMSGAACQPSTSWGCPTWPSGRRASAFAPPSERRPGLPSSGSPRTSRPRRFPRRARDSTSPSRWVCWLRADRCRARRWRGPQSGVRSR